MALTDKKYEKFYKTTGTGGDKIDSSKLSFAEEVWDLDRANGMKDHINDPDFAPLIFQLQQIQDELDYLRTEISTNKDKTGISSSQASAITANTAKTGITTQQANAITANEKAVTNNASEISKSNTNISTNTTAIATAVKVAAYPSVPSGITQSHGSEIIFDSKNKKYYMVIYYIEDTAGQGGKKGQRTIRTGQIQLT